MSRRQKTSTQLRNETTQRDLITVSEEMAEAMRRAGAAEAEQRKKYEADPESKERGNFREYDQTQRFFIDVSKDRFFEPGHPARIVDEVVERLNLEAVYEQYSKEGSPAYHPKMMFKILFYAYYVGLMSSRTIWDAVANRADFMYLAAGHGPNFRTINAFRLRHIDQLPDLFAQVVMMCKELGMIGFEHMAVDGQKIHANANFRKSKNMKGVREEYAKLKAGLDKLLNQDVSEHVSQETIDVRAQRLKRKLDQLARLQEELEKLGDEERRLNMTDRDAPVMRHKDGTSKPSYNHQSAVDEKHGVTTAVQTTLSGDQPSDLQEIVDASVANTGVHHGKVTADSGFSSYDVLEQIEERSEDFYVPDRRLVQAKRDGDEKKRYGVEDFPLDENGVRHCPAGHAMKYEGQAKGPNDAIVDRFVGTGCAQCSRRARCTTAQRRTVHIDTRDGLRQAMREKLRSDEGRETYMKRQGVVESPHGDDQKNHGWRQHLLRGYRKASAEFMLIRLVRNIGKIIRFGRPELLQT